MLISATGPQLEYDDLDLNDERTAPPLEQAPLTGPFGAAPFAATPLGSGEPPADDLALEAPAVEPPSAEPVWSERPPGG